MENKIEQEPMGVLAMCKHYQKYIKPGKTQHMVETPVQPSDEQEQLSPTK